MMVNHLTVAQYHSPCLNKLASQSNGSNRKENSKVALHLDIDTALCNDLNVTEHPQLQVFHGERSTQDEFL